MEPTEALRKHFGERIRQSAEQWYHVREVGKNASFNDKTFETLIRKAGWWPGAPWCAFAVRMIWTSVYDGTPLEKEVRAILNGSVIQTWRNAKGANWPTTLAPTIGGIMCLDAGKGRGHEGITVELSAKDEFLVYNAEGNTNMHGEREGEGFYRKRRNLANMKKTKGNYIYLGTIPPVIHGLDPQKYLV